MTTLTDTTGPTLHLVEPMASPFVKGGPTGIVHRDSLGETLMQFTTGVRPPDLAPFIMTYDRWFWPFERKSLRGQNTSVTPAHTVMRRG